MSRHWSKMLFAALVLVLLPAAVEAQSESAHEPSVSGSGVAVVRRPATSLRMYFTLSGKGKTIEEAMSDFKARRDNALALLEKLGADKRSISVGSPSISAAAGQRRHQLEQMIRQRMRSGGPLASKAVKIPKSVDMQAVLVAQWPLEGRSPEELFLAAQQVQARVVASKLAGDKAKLSAEEEEIVEEMEAQNGMSYGGDDQPDPGVPSFVYVGVVAESDRQQALSEAFQKAKADAQRVARAAGADVGGLVSVSGGGSGAANVVDYNDPTVRAYQQYMQRQSSLPENPELKEGEAIGQEPSVTFSYNVHATFRLEKPAK
jgi:uncharacterized protein YggE